MPRPTNGELNDFIDSAVHEVNRRTGFAARLSTVRLEVAAQTSDGPYVLDLRAVPTTGPAGSINKVRSVWWEDSSGNCRHLDMTFRSAVEAGGLVSAAVEVGEPRMCWVDAYALHVLPAPSEAGYLNIRVGHGIVGPIDDLDTFADLPISYHDSVLHVAFSMWVEANPMDLELASRMQVASARREAEIAAIAQWLITVSGRVQGRLVYRDPVEPAMTSEDEDG
jgi:hypothetical protein